MVHVFCTCTCDVITVHTRKCFSSADKLGKSLLCLNKYDRMSWPTVGRCNNLTGHSSQNQMKTWPSLPWRPSVQNDQTFCWNLNFPNEQMQLKGQQNNKRKKKKKKTTKLYNFFKLKFGLHTWVENKDDLKVRFHPQNFFGCNLFGNEQKYAH